MPRNAHSSPSFPREEGARGWRGAKYHRFVRATDSKSRLKDPFSAVSHYLGAGLAVVGLIHLGILTHSWPLAFWSTAFFGVTLVFQYLASGIYHTVPDTPDSLQKIDHAAIYILILGTYTPVCLLALPKIWGYTLLGIQLILALIGLVFVFRFDSKPRWLRIVLCATMGWLVVVATKPLLAAFPIPFWWLLAGGVVYSIGTIIYGTQRPRLWPGKFGSHDLWHLFVIGGSLCHFIAIEQIVRLTLR